MPWHVREGLDDPTLRPTQMPDESKLPEGFNVKFRDRHMVGKEERGGFYNVDTDPRVKTEKQKSWVIDKLMNHQMIDVYFKLYDPSDEDAGASVAEVDSLKAQLEEANKKLASAGKK